MTCTSPRPVRETRHSSTTRNTCVGARAPVACCAVTILVVEDHDDSRQLLVDILQTAGYVTREARHGREALAVLKDQGDIGMILLDLNMPVMSGWEVLKEIECNPQWCQLPLALVTAMAGRDLPAGYTVIAKPLDFDTVLRTVRAAETS